MGTQTEIEEKIKQRRADYTLAVKENQKNLYKEIKCNNGYKVTKEKSHSPIKIREYYQCDKLKWMQEKGHWKRIKSIGMVCKTTKQSGKQITERRYYISSLPLNVELLARTIREHWSVESMQWHLDVTFKEDINTTLNKTAVQNLNIINKWCLLILKLFEVGKRMSLRKNVIVSA